MPIKSCKMGGKPGFKYGDSGKCYSYSPGNKESMMAAKKKAIKQGLAIGGGKLVESVLNDLMDESGSTLEQVELVKMVASEWPKTLDDYKELVKLKELHEVDSSEEYCG